MQSGRLRGKLLPSYHEALWYDTSALPQIKNSVIKTGKHPDRCQSFAPRGWCLLPWAAAGPSLCHHSVENHKSAGALFRSSKFPVRFAICPHQWSIIRLPFNSHCSRRSTTWHPSTQFEYKDDGVGCVEKRSREKYACSQRNRLCLADWNSSEWVCQAGSSRVDTTVHSSCCLQAWFPPIRIEFSVHLFSGASLRQWRARELRFESVSLD